LGTVGHYNLLEQLDPVGPGKLYRARDTRLGRTVAVRILPDSFAGDAGSRAHLLERMRAIAALSHPNVTTVFEGGEDRGRLYVVFEFLKGQSLRAELAGRMMNVRRALDVAIQIADGVAYAHAAGFVHGGLSPDSIVITDKGHAKIPAFELATRAGFDQHAEDGRLRDYDSPEEGRGQPADERSDIYSVGAVLYETLTTRRPLHRGASAPSASNRHVPPELDEIVLKAVAPDPAARIQSAANLAAQLRMLAARLDVREATASDSHPPERAANVVRVVVLAVIILAGLGVVAWWVMQ
jgi:serine/threonine-protein kinase